MGPLTKKNFWKLFFRWLWTLIFSLLVFAVAKVYQDKGNITKTQKGTYNLVQTILILVLGLNFFEALKELVGIARWNIGAWTRCDNEEHQMIEDIGSLLTVFRLLRRSFAKPRIAFFCVAWLALNLIAQMAVASISLTYSVDDGTDYRDTYIRDGIVDASNLSCYFHKSECPSADVTRHALAHDYGGYGSAFTSDCGNYTDITDVLNSDTAYPYYCRRSPGRQEFAYRFNEYNFDDIWKSYPYLTNRIITVGSGDCFTYRQTGKPINVTDVNGDGDGRSISFKNDTYNGSIDIPNANLGLQGTTYTYQGIHPPAEAKTVSCGHRCITMWAYKNPESDAPELDNPESETPRFYQCPITVSEVSNAMQDAHKIPNGVAREAAASIALQGRWSGPYNDKHWMQYQFYANGADREIHNLSPDDVGAKMAEFALLSLITMVNRNPPIQIRGTVPYLGSHLVTPWSYFIGLLSCITGVHLALFVVTVLWVKMSAKYGGMSSLIAGDINELQERILEPPRTEETE